MKLSAQPSEHAHIRTDRIVEAIRAAMAGIEKEIEQNEWLYPYNRGNLSQAELCRRAAVAQMTLQNPSHKKTTLPWVNAWLKRVNAAKASGGKTVREIVTGRVVHWKGEYQKVATNYDISRLEVGNLTEQLVDKDKELKEARAKIEELMAANRTLQIEVSEGKVVKMPLRPRAK